MRNLKSHIFNTQSINKISNLPLPQSKNFFSHILRSGPTAGSHISFYLSVPRGPKGSPDVRSWLIAISVLGLKIAVISNSRD